MHPEPENSSGSLKGSESQRRQRAVHKIRLGELSSLDPERISAMVASGDIELLVRRSDIADATDGGWNERVGRLFRIVAESLDGAPEHENRTIIVNLIASGSHGGH